MLVSLNKGTPKYYNPHHGDLQKGTPNLRQPPNMIIYEAWQSRSECAARRNRFRKRDVIELWVFVRVIGYRHVIGSVRGKQRVQDTGFRMKEGPFSKVQV